MEWWNERVRRLSVPPDSSSGLRRVKCEGFNPYMARKTNKPNGAGNGPHSEGMEGNGRAATGQSEPISTEEIAARAYQIYEREGRTDGRDVEHWHQAEAELRAERSGDAGRQEAVAQPGSQSSQPTAPRSARLQQQQAA